nr:mitogen-activated protein kinase kinase kinase 2-like [Ipomoea batatas]
MGIAVNILLVEKLGQPEVAELEALQAVELSREDKNVAGLQVAVDDSQGVHVMDTFKKLLHLAVFKSAGKMEMAVKSTAIQGSCSLEREGMFLDALRDCPFVVRCFGEDVSMEHGQHVYNLLMEYASGGTTGGMSELLSGFYIYQLLKGIHYMHNLRIIHCDLKPDNVLVFPGNFNGLNRLKLCDFGLAKLSDEMNVYGDCHRGTLLYAAPECVAWKSYTAAKDIWALGCLFVEMVTGKPMWQIGNEQDLAKKIASGNPEIPENLSPEAKSFLKVCLARDPWRRWTANRLLGHRFFERFGALESKEGEGFVNPLGPWRWSSSRDLFTVPSFTYIVEDVVQKEKEKEKDIEGSESIFSSSSFGVAFEEAWMRGREKCF